MMTPNHVRGVAPAVNFACGHNCAVDSQPQNAAEKIKPHPGVHIWACTMIRIGPTAVYT